MATLNEELRTLLNQVCEGRQANSPAALIKLEDCLLNNKDILINLLQDKPKKPEDRTTLISGNALVYIIVVKRISINRLIFRQSNY